MKRYAVTVVIEVEAESHADAIELISESVWSGDDNILTVNFEDTQEVSS